MRALRWIGVIAAGIVVVLVVTALVGNSDRSGETVPASEWAQSVCGAVGVWRGEIKAAVADVRLARAIGGTTEEPQSQTKQAGNSRVRQGLESSVQATKTMVIGIDDAGTPDAPGGDQAAEEVSDWADESVSNLEDAQDALEDEPDTLDQAVEQLGVATKALGATLTSGIETIVGAAQVDPALTAAFKDSSTCQELRKKERSS
jgi:hypothetical protein